MSRLNSCDPFLKQIVSKQKVASVRLATFKKYDTKIIQKNFNNKKDAHFFKNMPKKKSSRFIIGVSRHSNFCEPKK